MKSSSSKIRIRKVQKLRSDGKQLTESQNKRIQRISKVAHSSGQWTEFGVGKMLIRSIQSCSARRKVYGDKKRQYLYLQEYLSTLKYSSDTVVALSLYKRVYALLCKHENSALVLPLFKRVSTFLLIMEIPGQQNLQEVLQLNI